MSSRGSRVVAYVLGAVVLLAVGVVTAWFVNPSYVPVSVSAGLFKNFGERPYAPPQPSAGPPSVVVPELCSERNPQWRAAQTIEGVDIEAAPECNPDNPYTVAATVLGTNNVSRETLVKSGLARDAVVKGRDLDGDGDPDEVEIHLEVTELNGFQPDAPIPAPGYEVAPGIKPSMWVFSPKSFGMSTVNFESYEAQPLLRAPTPVIRVEQGDVVKIVLENTHYLPHTIHLHGVDLPFKTARGEGNDGVPGVSEISVMPGQSRVYEFQPRSPGLFMYHCHVQTHIHLSMGLVGMLIVEPNKPNNWLQTLNIGAGRVRHRSQASKESYQSEYDLNYHEVDQHLSQVPQHSNDIRSISQEAHFLTPGADNSVNLLNGRAFPFTLRESMITVAENQKVLVNVLNSGMHAMSLHPHGHRFTPLAMDGGNVPEAARSGRDIVLLGASQRAQYELDTKNDGTHAFGPGAWLLHDHRLEAVTNGVSPGGELGMIVYPDYMGVDGMPKLAEDPSVYFSKEYYEKNVPVFAPEEASGRFNPPVAQTTSPGAIFSWLAALFSAGGLTGYVFSKLSRRKQVLSGQNQ